MRNQPTKSDDVSVPVYELTLRPDGRGLTCDPPGPCRCGHSAWLFFVRGAEIGCTHCMPDHPHARFASLLSPPKAPAAAEDSQLSAA